MSFPAASVTDDDNRQKYDTEGIVEVKLYPSSILNERTVSTNETGAWTPNQLRALMHNFRNLDRKDRPYIVVEHSTKKCDRLGRVIDITYNEIDGWMWVKGKIKKKKKQQFEDTHVYANGKKGVSLCYVVGEDYKGFLEFSFVKNPDFKNASLVRYHSSSNLLATIHCLGPADIPAQLNAARLKMSEQPLIVNDNVGGDDDDDGAAIDYSDKYIDDNGEYIISTHDHFEGVRGHLLNKGVTHPKIIVANVDHINTMPEHKRNLLLAGLLSHENKRAVDTDRIETEEKQRAFTAEANEARNLALLIATNNPLFTDDVMKSQLGKLIMTDHSGRLVAQAASQALSIRDQEIAKRDATIQALNEDVKKRKKQDAALFERNHIRQHAAVPMTDWASFWKDCSTKAEQNGVSASSSSSPIQSSLKKAFDAGATIHSHSASPAKRSRSDHVDDERERLIDLHKRSKWMGMALHPHPDDNIKIVQHSASDGCSRAIVSKTGMPSDTQHSISFYQDIVTGRRSIGTTKKKRDHTKGLGVQCPQMMLALMHLVSGPAETNGQAGIFGSEDSIPADYGGSVRHLLPYVGSTRDAKYNHLRIDADELLNPSVDMPNRRLY